MANTELQAKRAERKAARMAKRKVRQEEANVYRGTITGIGADQTLIVSIDCGFGVVMPDIETRLIGVGHKADFGSFTAILDKPALFEVAREGRVWRSTVYAEKEGGWLNLNQRLAGAVEYADEAIDDRMYWYKLDIHRVYDADTITSADATMLGPVPLKFVAQKFRLLGLNAPEMRGDSKPYGQAAKDAFLSMIEGREVSAQIQGDKRGKYGRWLTTVWSNHDGEWVNVNAWLVANGHAVPFMV